MTDHTPTPWAFTGSVRQVDRDRLWCGDIVPPKSSRYRGEICHLQSADQIDGINRDEAAANAAFIVKSVNNHDALVDALEEIVSAIVLTGQLKDLVDRVLAAVGGGHD